MLFPPFSTFRSTLNLLLAILLTSGWLHAAPYGPGGMPVEFTQPDGSKISLRVFGDEYYGRAETLDGFTVVFDPATKTYYYAALSPDGNEFASTGKVVGKADPNALGVAKRLEINPASRAAKARANHAAHEAVVKQGERWEAVKQANRNYRAFKNEVKKQEKAGKKGFVIPLGTVFPDSVIPPAPQMEAPAAGDGTTTEDPPVAPAPPNFTLTGDVVGLTILVDFSDVPGTVVTQAQVDDYFNKPNYTGFSQAGSVYDYFFIQSGGKLRYNNNVTYYVRVPQPKTYYNNTSVADNCGTCGRLLLNDALTVLLANGYDFSKLTTKAGGNIRACNVFFAGADSGVWSSGLWPHRWVLSPSKAVGGGKYVYDYQITNIGTTAALRIGTVCHENGHMLLGYPDLYSYDGNAANFGNYSLMAGGNYGGSPAGTHPTNIDPYLKEASGWMDVIDLNSASQQRCTVQVDGNQVYRYLNPAKATEYFMFEVRDNTGWEGPYGAQTGSVNPGTGLVAYHAYETGSNTYSTIFTASNPNCSYTKPYELLVVEANQTTAKTPWYDDPTPDTSDAFRLSGKSAISDATTPDLKFWVPLATGGGRLTNSGANINTISADSNVMTFVAGAGTLSTTPGLVLSRSTINSYCNFGANAASQTFTICNSQGGTLNYNITSNQSWLSCTPTTGTATTESDTITINYATSGLAAGSYTGTITVTDPAASPTTKTITVTLTVTAQPVMALSTTTIAKTGTTGMSGPQASFGVNNTGGGTMSYTVSATQPWLSLSPASGTVVAETDTVYANFNATSLAPGTYTDTITVTSAQATNSPRTIGVTFTVQGTDMIVTSPNGGEVWNRGETKAVTWASTLGGNVKIELLKGGVLESILTTSTPNDGSFDWVIPGVQTAASDYTVRITSVETPAKFDTSNAVFSIVPTLADALDNSDLTWVVSGNSNWFYQSTTTKDGVDAAQSGAIGDNQSSYLEATVTGPGTMTFWWKVSSESGFDFLRFYIDGTEQTGSLARISGTVDWVQKTVTIPTGSHIVKWGYTKDGSAVSGSDAAWVDQVGYTPDSAPEIAVEQPVGTNLTDGTASIDCGPVNLGSDSSPVTITVKNVGTAPLTGLSLSQSGAHSADFTLGSLVTTTLAIGASTTFDVIFSPSASGTRTAALQIASNDANENPFDINLTGTGVPLGTLAVTPSAGLTSSGNFGGPFAPASQVYTLTNTGSTLIDWTAAKTQSWVTLSPTGGSLAPGANTTVTVSFNANALNIGNYSDTVTFSNTTNSYGNTTRAVSLTVNPIPVTVTLGNLLQTYDGNPKPVTVTTNPTPVTYSVTYDGLSTVPTNAGTYAVVATVTQANHTGSAPGSLTINKAAQTITFGALSPVLDNAAPFTLGATTTSGLTVYYSSSNTSVATVSGNTVTVVGLGSTTITASQAGDANYNAAASVPQTLTVNRSNPLAVTGGPYKVLIGQSLSLNGSASQPSYGATISTYEWDLNRDDVFGDATGATPPAITFDALTDTYGMLQGLNNIKLKVTDSSGKTSIVSTTVELVLALTWDANGTTAGQTNGSGAWLAANLWWDGAANQSWAAGSNATFGGPSTAGGAVTLASPTSVNAITFNTHTGTYTLGTAGQTLTINGGINKTSTSAVAVINSPVVLGAAQTWTNSASGTNSLSMGGNGTGAPVDNGGNLLTIDGTGPIYLKWAAISGGGGLTKNGTGYLELGGQYTGATMYHTYTGTTTLNGGTMRVVGDSGTNGNLGSGNLTLNGGVLEYYYSGSFIRTLGTGVGQVQILGGTSGFGFGSSGTVTLNNSAAYEAVWGSPYFNPSTLVLNPPTSAGTITFANKLDFSGSTRTIQTSAGTARISGIIRTSTGTAGLTKTGAGILALDAANTYNGDTTISGGALRIGNNTAGTLGNGNYAGNISIASGSNLQIWSTAATQTLSGVISGAGGLSKAYAGTLTLSNLNTYTGKTSITPQTTAGAGILSVSSFNSVNGGTPLLAFSSLGAPTTVANGTIDFGSTGIQGGATLKYTGTGETTDRVINFLFNGTGATKTLDASGSGLLKFTSTFTGSGSTTNDVTLQGTSNGEIVGGLPFVFRNLSKAGGNTWTLGGSCLHTGTTTITAGKLALGASNVLPDGTAVTIGAATLDAATFSDTLGTLDVTSATSTINLGSGAALAFADSSAIDWTGGTVNLTGTFISGVSLRFGTTNTALTSTQLLKFAGTGLSSFALNGDGYLTAVGGGGDTTPPTLTSIVDDKSGNPVIVSTPVTYTVTFSEDMDASTVTAADFGNAGTSTVSIGAVTETSPGIFTVQATPTTSGTLRLRVNQSAVLKDMAGNSLNTVSDILDDTMITVTGDGDITPPTLAASAIVDDRSGNPCAVNAMVTYTVTFSEDMDATTVTATDFGNADSSAVTIGSVNEITPGVFTVQATPTTAGTLQLSVNEGAELKDVAGNALNTTLAIADNTTITVDGTVPTLASIVDDRGGNPCTLNTMVTYTVTFSEDMDASTVAAEDFGNASATAVTIGAVTEISPGVFTVQATPTIAGTLQLRVNASAVLKDAVGNDLNTTSPIADDTTITVDGIVPTLAASAIVDNKTGNPVTVNTLVTYTVTFSEDMDANTFTAADFGNAGTSTVTIGTITETTPTSGVFTVQATPTTAGTLQLKVNAAAVLKDVAGNSLDTTLEIADDTTIIVDGDVPTLAGTNIVDDKGGNPVNVNTLVTYTVTFNEDMDHSTVTADDFANAGSSAVTIGTVTETTPTSGIFTVQATPTTAGTLQLQVKAAAELKDLAGNSLVTTTAIADDTTITVNPISATITYNGNGSTGGTAPVDATSYNLGATVTVLSAGSLEKTGYTFAGWNTSANGSGTGYMPTNTFTISSDVTLYAQWTINTYTVSYNANSATSGTAPADQIKTYDVSLTLATNSGGLVRTGYTFSGWNTLADGTGTDYAAGGAYIANASVTLYAKWTILTYTVSYDGNGATFGTVPSDQIKIYNVNLTLDANSGSLARNGYTFSGWNTAANGSGTNYAAGATYATNAPLTLYATWTANTYTVTFDANGGTAPSPASISVTYASTYGTLATTTRTGYTFNGWFTDPVSGVEVKASTFVSSPSDHTLYAQWTQANPEISVTRGGSAVADGGYDAVSGISSGTGTQLIYSIANGGTSNLTLESAVKARESNCTVVINTQPTSPVLPAGSTNLVLTVTPTAVGAWSFTVSIPNDDANEAPYNWTIHGVAQSSTTATFIASADTYIDANNSATPYGAAETINLNNYTKQPQMRQGLINFNLGSVPVGAMITSASLDFVAAGGKKGSVEIFNTSGTWGASAATWAISSGVVGTTSYGSATITDAASRTPVNISLNASGRALIQGWIDGWTDVDVPKNGFSIKTNYSAANTSSVTVFSADYTTNTSYRPKLNLTYTETPSVAEMDVTRDGLAVANGGTDAVSGTAAGAGTQLNYTIANLGNLNLTMTTPVSTSGTSNCTVSFNTQPASPVAVSTSTNLVMTVTPTTGGAWSATVSIAKNDVSEPSYDWTISGNATGGSYTVTYNANDATSGTVPSDQAKLQGVDLTLATNSGNLARTGYVFSGWNTLADGTGTDYAAGGTYSANAAVTLYAKWTAMTTPTVNTWPTAAVIVEGQALSSATLTGGSASVAGSFSYDSPSVIPAVGTYSAAVTFTPTDATSYNTVPGTVNVTVLTVFNGWAGAGNTFNGDANGDGVADGMAWLLGATTLGENATALMPPATVSNGNLAVGFKCLKASKRGSAVLKLQYSKDLGAADLWTSHTITIPESSGNVGGVAFTITQDPGNSDLNQVQATVPASEAGIGGKIFVRLTGVIP